MSSKNSALIFLLLVATTIALCSADANCVKRSDWTFHKGRFGKRYSGAEEGRRCNLFAKNVDKINQHNHQSNHTWLMGVNHLTEWTDEEIDKLSGARVDPSFLSAAPNNNASTITKRQSFPDSLDLSSILGSIRDQGQCGSCWAFATCATIEYAIMAKTGYMADLAEQQLLDCVYQRSGCNGGWMFTAYSYIANNGGIDFEFSYPYTGTYSGSCGATTSLKWARLQQSPSYVQVASDDDSIKSALANHGVLSVCVDSTNWGPYASGIFVHSTTADDLTCKHAVALVGYGVDSDSGTPFWKIRNSWRDTWGEQGYMRLDATRASNGNTIGGIMLNYAYYPILYQW